MQNDLLIKSLKRQPCSRTPIWFMRQAGRYLPQYQNIRKKHDFLTLCKTAELAAEVTLQPVDFFDLDAAIIFSDILVVPEAMGMELNILESVGPVFNSPIRTTNQFDKLKHINIENELEYVANAIKLVKRTLNNTIPLIGFSGSPWTLMAYMVDGEGKTNFKYSKCLLFENEAFSHIILEKLSKNIINYLSMQINAGVNIIQIFDTWGGLLTREHYLKFSLRYIKKIVDNLKQHFPDIPIIVFSKGVFLFEEIAKIGCDAVSVDWCVSLKEVRKRTNDMVSIQGNLDPIALFKGSNGIKSEVINVLEDFGKIGPSSGHVFNLGHGIIYDTPIENVQEMVKTVKECSQPYHA